MHDATQVASKTQPPTQVASVTICDKAISRVVYKEQPVLTFALIDQLHQRVEGTAADRFKKNRQRFIENEDFYLIDYSKKGILYPFGIDIPPRGLIVLTQTGYAMLVKSFTDDLAWQVQRELVNKYFATPQPTNPPANEPILEHAKFNKELMDLFGIQGNMQALALNNAMRKKFGVDLLETWDVGGIKAETQEQLLTVSDIAKRLAQKPRQINPILTKLGLQTSNRDHKNRLYYELTDKGRKHGTYLDTGKKHSDGTAVRQIKWYDSVVGMAQDYLIGGTAA
ncbi:MAG: ORF6N domain-containing protein [Pseudomonadota bacterium]